MQVQVHEILQLPTHVTKPLAPGMQLAAYGEADMCCWNGGGGVAGPVSWLCASIALETIYKFERAMLASLHCCHE